MRAARLNAMTEDDARAAMLRCCGSTRWADTMVEARPFADDTPRDAPAGGDAQRAGGTIEAAAEHAFSELTTLDWLEAFAHHPRIGDVSKLRERFAHSGDLSEKEQGHAMAAAQEDVIQALFTLNQTYERRHGHIFIVCATGKSAAEMKALLEARIDLPPELEIDHCAAEQKKITALRLQAL